MELLGMPVVQIYLYALIIAGLATILYVFFSDIAEGIGEGNPFLDPAVILPFITFVAATGYIMELTTDWNSSVIIVSALIIAFILDLLLYFFVLLPLSSAEVSLAYTDESLIGQVGKVIVPVPVGGFGEIVFESVNGIISKRAAGYENASIDYGKEVLVIEVKDGTFIVKEYEPFRFANMNKN
ncbi:NfeD family protein [Sporosarcina sp. G11-34]|uniref:NfeD family protein n=1 Tax=Sporosarcina sp. G11-34 TaxID=2849605 RepID=UPI0022A96B21|nr:NfeD family protein [Sporosarcina sp. G11-34]MCZ2259332.1 NfeD family protein [Sporosarcina sp. G11-34]